MIMEGIRRSIYGIAFGGIITFIAITIVHFTDTNTSVSQIWLYMLCTFVLGIYFGLSSLIFSDNGWSMLIQTIVHFSVSIIVYLIIALSAGWVPLRLFPILLTSFIFIGIYTLNWTGYYLYFKKVEKSMNANLKKNEYK
ncbi:DUF3021 domain-containing protein [Ornithinibacillus sp. JPR2-1]|uniref:DUF3021 domain-containing protein n=1 Tax=Ornithinibacillus sp. JPR2-1 TaxID=2094019 RepID=UPI0031CE058D